MSVKQMSLVWEHRFLHPQQVVMLALADHAHDDGSSIYPSVDYLAWKTGYCRRSVQNIIGDLRSSGVLQLVREANHKTPNEYAFDWSKALTKQPFDRGAKAVKEPPVRGAVTVEDEADRGATPMQEECSSGAEGCSSGASGVQPVAPEPSLTISKNHQRTITQGGEDFSAEPFASSREGENHANLLASQHPQVFASLCRIKSIAKANTPQFQAWAGRVLTDCRTFDPARIQAVLEDMAMSWGDLNLPWAWYAKQITQLPKGSAAPKINFGDVVYHPEQGEFLADFEALYEEAWRCPEGHFIPACELQVVRSAHA